MKDEDNSLDQMGHRIPDPFLLIFRFISRGDYLVWEIILIQSIGFYTEEESLTIHLIK